MYRDVIGIDDIAKGYSISMSNTKMGSIPSISTVPGEGLSVIKSTGEFIIDVPGTCSGVCSSCKGSCYAINTMRIYRNTAKSWGRNTKLAMNDVSSYGEAIYNYCKKLLPKYFRIHVGGEFFSYEQLCSVMEWCDMLCDEGVPTIVYTYTKRHEYFNRYMREHGSMPDNVQVLLSQWGEAGKNDFGFPEFWYDDGSNAEVSGMVHCPGVGKDGRQTGKTCDICGICQNAKNGMKLAVYAH